jgi:hypothetical protein
MFGSGKNMRRPTKTMLSLVAALMSGGLEAGAEEVRARADFTRCRHSGAPIHGNALAAPTPGAARTRTAAKLSNLCTRPQVPVCHRLNCSSVQSASQHADG